VERGEDEVTRECSLDGDIGGLTVANLADHDDVRVLAHNRLESFGKSVFLSRNLRLYDAVEVIFNRVFNRDYFYFRRVDLAEEGIECCRFAAPRWASGE
jgi:hypothetical protein